MPALLIPFPSWAHLRPPHPCLFQLLLSFSAATAPSSNVCGRSAGLPIVPLAAITGDYSGGGGGRCRQRGKPPHTQTHTHPYPLTSLLRILHGCFVCFLKWSPAIVERGNDKATDPNSAIEDQKQKQMCSQNQVGIKATETWARTSHTR